MLPLLAPLVGMLMNKGLEIAGKAIEGGGEKVLEKIEEKTGISLDAKKGLSAKDIQVLKEYEKANEEELMAYHLKNTESARDMNSKIQESENASELAKNASYFIDFFVIGSTMALALIILFAEIPEGNIQIVNIMFGAMLGYVGTIINFHRGSSHGSKSKTDTLLKAAVDD